MPVFVDHLLIECFQLRLMQQHLLLCLPLGLRLFSQKVVAAVEFHHEKSRFREKEDSPKPGQKTRLRKDRKTLKQHTSS